MMPVPVNMNIRQRFKNLFLRLLNGVSLKYSLGEVFKLILFRKLISFKNSRKFTVPKSTIDLYLDQIETLIISLEFRNDRRIVLVEAFKHTGLDFIFVDAIHGKEINRKILSRSSFSLASTIALTDGSLGCILSHVKALNQFISSKKKYCLILEDDVVIENSFSETLSNTLQNLPTDLEILYLVSKNLINENLVTWIRKDLYSPLYPRYGQQAYIVSKFGAQKILANLFPIKITLGGIDTLIGRLITKKKLTAYHIYPNLCNTNRSSPSNIYNYSISKKTIHSSE